MQSCGIPNHRSKRQNACSHLAKITANVKKLWTNVEVHFAKARSIIKVSANAYTEKKHPELKRSDKRKGHLFF